MPGTRQEVGKRIQALRKARGWTQESLAERSGMHPTYVGGIERGERNATISSYGRIADAFGLSLAGIFALEQHDLETLFNAPSEDILLAVLRGFRAQVDVKGKLAELYMAKYLEHQKNVGVVDDFTWSDKDGLPDFVIVYKGNDYVAECKNLRSGKDGIYKKKPSHKVELQKTRNSKDGTNTRSYPVDHFQMLAVCTFNQTGRWNFFFIASKNLARTPDDMFLKVFHPVPFDPIAPWYKDISTVLEDIAKD